MGFSQVVVIVVSIIFLLFAANRHSQLCNAKINFWIALTAVCLHLATLAFGGFFDGAFNFVF